MEGTADGGFELSGQQELLWLTEPDGPRSQVQCCARLPDGAVAADVSRALQLSVSRHEALRTLFARPTGMRTPVQVIAEDLPAHWATARPSAEHAPAELAAAEWAEPFDLAGGPLVRGLLVDGPGDRRELILTAPAVVADAKTLLHVVEEIHGELAGRPSDADPLQYADYAAWQREQEPPPAAAAAGPTVIGLPFRPADRRPATQQAVLPVTVDPVAVSALRDLASRQQLPLQDAWLAMWLLLAARLTGHPELAVSVAVDGRGLEELAGAAGPYEMGLPISCPPSASERFQDFLGRVGTARAEAVRPSAQVLPPEPLPLGFAWREVPAGVHTLRGYQIGGQVQLEVTSAGSVELRYDAGSVGRREADRVAAHLQRLLGSVASRPDAPVGSLEVLPAADRALLLAGPHTPPTTAPAVSTLIEEAAARGPSAPAVAAAGSSLTYAELDGRANALAHLLRACGVGTDTPVAICLDRTCDLIVAVLAVLKAGGAYLPLNPEHPRPRLAYQLADAAPPVLLTQHSLVSALPDCAADVVCLDRDRARIDGYPRTRPPVEPRPEDLAYLVYTSGSTGTPKGVAVRHGALTNYTTALLRALGTDGDPLRYAMVTTMSTDLGNTAVFPALVSGGCLDLVPVDVAMDAAAYAEHAAAEPVDVLKITPSHLAALLAGGGQRVLPRRHLIVGGEAFSWTLAEQVLDASRCELINHYGPTETTVGSLTYDVRSADETARRLTRTVPIGRAIDGTTALVVDWTGGLAPDGVVGELLIGGAGLARGYWNAPELTADRFITNPLGGTAGDRLYRTGDLVRRLPDGALEFVDRNDDQVKIRGFRVELGEIEAVLGQQPQVQAAAVVAPSDDDGTRRIMAYVVGAADAPPDLEALRGQLSALLPAYMVPGTFVPLERLPLSATGKVDRAALPDPGTAQPSALAVPPRTDIERRLARIWSAVLGVEPIGVTDDFFGLGGHSLLATQVLARIRHEFEVQLPLPSLFLAPTVEALATLVEERLPRPNDDDLDQLLAQLENLTEEEAERLLHLDSKPPE